MSRAKSKGVTLPVDMKAVREAIKRNSSHLDLVRALGLTPVGYWTNSPEAKNPEAGLLWPGDLVDPKWDSDQRLIVAEYLKAAGETFMVYLGFSYCRLCEQKYGASTPQGDRLPDWQCLGTKDLSDGKYVWPEGYPHYLTDHAVKPPQHFIDHILSELRK